MQVSPFWLFAAVIVPPFLLFVCFGLYIKKNVLVRYFERPLNTYTVARPFGVRINQRGILGVFRKVHVSQAIVNSP